MRKKPQYGYTHTYRVTGLGKSDTSYLTPLERDCHINDNKEYVFVSLGILPTLYADKIPDGPLDRSGEPGTIFIELWDNATVIKAPFYRKGDWNIMDDMLFRGVAKQESKYELKETFLRLWAISREEANPYDMEKWYRLYRYIQPGE